MANLARYLQKIFASAAGDNEIAEYGSLIGDPPGNLYNGSTITPAIVQNLSNFEGGQYDAVGGVYSPTIQDHNALFYLFSYQLAYLLQKGIPEWDSATTYYKDDVVKAGSVVYTSITDNNLNNSFNDPNNWRSQILTLAQVAANDSNVSFTQYSNRFQSSLPTANRTYSLPNIGIKAGDTWYFYNRSSSYNITIHSNDTHTITTCYPKGFVVIQSNKALPETETDWDIIQNTAASIAPTIQKFTSGTGTYTLPTSPKKPTYIKVKMCGGGGGGSGSAGGAENGGNGGDTVFGSITADGGGGGIFNSNGGTGGSFTISLGTGFGFDGNPGGGSMAINVPITDIPGGNGGQNLFASFGYGGVYLSNDGQSPVANTGGGGGGGLYEFTGSGLAYSSFGGGAGGYLETTISSPDATYAYEIGAGGSGGALGIGGGHNGADGAAGIIIVEEYYN